MKRALLFTFSLTIVIGLMGLSRPALAQGQAVTFCDQDVACLWYQDTNANQTASIVGQSSVAAGISGQSTATSALGNGVEGISTQHIGVFGTSTCSTGGTCIGVFGNSTDGNGVWGDTQSSTNAAVVGDAPNGIAVKGIGVTAFYGSGDIQVTGNAYKPGGGSWSASSDRRVKKDVRNYDLGLSELLKLRPVHFKYNGLGGTADDGKEFVGVIAQELEKVLPSMVGARKAKLHASDKGDTEIKTVDPSEFTYLLIKSVQDQQRLIQAQDKRISELERGSDPVRSSVLGGNGDGLVSVLLAIGLAVTLKRRQTG